VLLTVNVYIVQGSLFVRHRRLVWRKPFAVTSECTIFKRSAFERAWRMRRMMEWRLMDDANGDPDAVRRMERVK
jgi:hypothetical protein